MKCEHTGGCESKAYAWMYHSFSGEVGGLCRKHRRACEGYNFEFRGLVEPKKIKKVIIKNGIPPRGSSLSRYLINNILKTAAKADMNVGPRSRITLSVEIK